MTCNEGPQNTCLVNADCVTGGKLAMVDDAFQYCDEDGVHKRVITSRNRNGADMCFGLPTDTWCLGHAVSGNKAKFDMKSTGVITVEGLSGPRAALRMFDNMQLCLGDNDDMCLFADGADDVEFELASGSDVTIHGGNVILNDNTNSDLVFRFDHLDDDLEFTYDSTDNRWETRVDADAYQVHYMLDVDGTPYLAGNMKVAGDDTFGGVITFETVDAGIVESFQYKDSAGVYVLNCLGAQDQCQTPGIAFQAETAMQTCNSGNKGLVQWDGDGTQGLCVCNGSSWQPIPYGTGGATEADCG
jgi:hypothetical protein